MKCIKCDGATRVWARRRDGSDHKAIRYVECPRCHGTGDDPWRCETCQHMQLHKTMDDGEIAWGCSAPVGYVLIQRDYVGNPAYHGCIHWEEIA